ncbi:MAG TPA: hypothetical protein VF510_21660 [Ktedonobacterales bacterium]
MKLLNQIVGGGRGGNSASGASASTYNGLPVRSSRSTLIGVDCDGVLASDRLLWQHMRARFPEHIPARYEELKTFEWPRATAETHALCQELSADSQFALRLTPMPGATQAIRRLSRQGYRIVMITARPDCVRDATRAWLLAQGISDDIEEIHCVPGGPAKAPLARALGCVAFVEDNHATAEAMGMAGLRSYLMDAPYNRMFTRRSVRVADWHALVADLIVRVPVRHSAPHVTPLPAPQALPQGAFAL